MTKFPSNWFFIKNRNNNYVLSSDKLSPGAPVIISSIKDDDNDFQLWKYDSDGRISNKMTGFVLDIAKETAKAGAEVIQRNPYERSESQVFDVSADGYIFLKNSPDLVLGVKESFFTRSEGLHVHLQKLDNASQNSKEQRWDLIPSADESFVDLGDPLNALTRSLSGKSSEGSSSDEDSLDDSQENQLNSFPEKDFFLKSDTTGQFLGIDINAVNNPGARLTLEPLRKSNYESQLWHFDKLTGRLINKYSGFCLTAENFKEDSFLCQSSSFTQKDLQHQSWFFTNAGEVKLKLTSHGHFVLGFKKEGWFNLNREGSPVLLQRPIENKSLSHQKFTVVLPIFRRKTTEIVTVTEQQGVFPDGYFFIKNQKHGLVITVDGSNKLAAQVLASTLDTKSFNRQLWRHENGFLFNKVSNLVLDVKGGCIISGSEICQYSQKKEGYGNQQWELSVEGHIYVKSHKNTVLAISEQKKDGCPIFLANKKTSNNEEQRWNFILPVIKRSSSVAETAVKTTVTSHQYAQYPSGWFFIRSFVGGSLNNVPFVVTADRRTHNVYITLLSKENWRHQLWTYHNGALMNFASQLAIDVDNVIIGTNVCQEFRQTNSLSQRFYLSIDGYLVHGSDPSLILVPEVIPNDKEKYRIVLSEYAAIKDDYRWGFLTPEIKFDNGSQVLVRWSVSLLSEWKNTKGREVQETIHTIANWPEETFFITGQDEMALVPEKSEAFSLLILKKLDYFQNEHFKWTFRDGYLVHVATGLVLHATDDLVGGSQPQIRERLLTSSKSIDQRQKWLIKTNGSIVSDSKTDLGFALVQKDDHSVLQLASIGETSEHYCWSIVHGHYESRYSETYKKQISVITRTESILLTVRSKQSTIKSDAELVTSTVGIFPENWFFICSKSDRLMVLTAPSKDEGAKLILSKLDFNKFRQQLWRAQDDGCLVNLASGYVIDVAGGAMNAGDNIIQWHQKYLKRYRKNQLWALSTDGHIHPQSYPHLVLGAKEAKVNEGSEIQLFTRGSLDLYHQLWTFSVPVFGKKTGDKVETVSVAGYLEKDDTSVFIKKVTEFSFETSTTEKYKETKITVIRRWGLFPEGEFFIRCSYGSEHLALAVERKPRSTVSTSIEYAVTLQPINFAEYQWYLWYYRDGHLYNTRTGLCLDASPMKGFVIEEGLRAPLFVRAKTMSDSQFWSLSVNGEVHLRSDERLVIGVANSGRATVSGAQVGLRQVRSYKFMNELKQQETSLHSEKWLQWIFSKPAYKTRTSTTSVETFASKITTLTGSLTTSTAASEKIVEGLTDQKLIIEEKEDLIDENSDNDSDDTGESITTNEESKSSSSKLNLLGNVSIAAGAGILTGATGIISKVFSSAPESMLSETTETRERSVTETSSASIKYSRKDSFNLDIDYIPTGSEKVLRYKSHQQQGFPTAGYFMVKSRLHGYVLDVADAQPKNGSFVILAPMKSTDFASQLWSYKNGYLVNVKGSNLVLNVSNTDATGFGGRVTLSKQTVPSAEAGQTWKLHTSSGLISLKSNQNLVLEVKDTKNMVSFGKSLEIYVQEEKVRTSGSNAASGEQHWEVVIPSMVAISENTNDEISQSRYTIIESGKISCISSSACAIMAFDSIKQTLLHKISADNQWPSSQNWFFIRAGTENAFLASGTSDSSEVKFVTLKDKEDHQQFLWMYMNGYLVNYKHMTRLTYDSKSKKLYLSKDEKTLDQTFCISSKGNLSLKTKKEVIYLNVSSAIKFLADGRTYQIIASKNEPKGQEGYIQLHTPVFLNNDVETESKVALTMASSWIQSTKKDTSVTSSTVTHKFGHFPGGTWFFINAKGENGGSLVLSVKGSSKEQGASLILSKLNVKDCRSQLWTFRDGLLINYGSKLVADLEGEVKELTRLVQSSEAGISTQKWSLSATGHIQLNSYSGYCLGCSHLGLLKEGIEVTLLKKTDSQITKSMSQVLTWSFSVPVFKDVSTTSIKSASISAIEKIASYIESGIAIESVQEESFRVEDISLKTNVIASTDTQTIQTEVRDTTLVSPKQVVVTEARDTTLVLPKHKAVESDTQVLQTGARDTTLISTKKTATTDTQIVQTEVRDTTLILPKQKTMESDIQIVQTEVRDTTLIVPKQKTTSDSQVLQTEVRDTTLILPKHKTVETNTRTVQTKVRDTALISSKEKTSSGSQIVQTEVRDTTLILPKQKSTSDSQIVQTEIRDTTLILPKHKTVESRARIVQTEVRDTTLILPKQKAGSDTHIVQTEVRDTTLILPKQKTVSVDNQVIQTEVRDTTLILPKNTTVDSSAQVIQTEVRDTTLILPKQKTAESNTKTIQVEMRDTTLILPKQKVAGVDTQAIQTEIRDTTLILPKEKTVKIDTQRIQVEMRDTTLIVPKQTTAEKHIEEVHHASRAESSTESNKQTSTGFAKATLMGTAALAFGATVALDAVQKVKDRKETKKSADVSETKTHQETKDFRKTESKKEEHKIKKATRRKDSRTKRQSCSDSSGSSSESDSEYDVHRNVQFVEASKYVTKTRSTDISTVVNEWYEKLIIDVSTHAKKGGSNATSDIEYIIQTAVKTITESLHTLSESSKVTITDTQVAKQYNASIEWARQLVVQSTLEIKTIGVNASISGSKTGGLDQMRTIYSSIQEQVDVETRRYNFTSDTVVQETRSTVVVQPEFKQTTGSITTKDEKSSGMVGYFKNTFAAGIDAGTSLYKKKEESVKFVHEKDIFSAHKNLQYDSGVSAIDNINTTVTTWINYLVEEISFASKSGYSSQQITAIVEKRNKELDQIIEYTKTTGSKYCASAKDQQEFTSKIEWVSSVAKTQAFQIQKIGINSASNKTNMSGQMTILANALSSEINVNLNQLKATTKFYEKPSKLSIARKSVEDLDVKKAVKTETAAETKSAYTVIQDTRVTTVALFSSLSDRIVARLKQGGSNVQEDINKMIESTQLQVNSVFSQAKSTCTSEEQRVEVDQALTTVQKSVQEQITQIKTTTVQATSTKTDTSYAINKVLEVSSASKTMIESSFTSVSETIAASFIAVTQTAQKATATVQGWYSGLSTTVNKLLETKDCTEEEKQRVEVKTTTHEQTRSSSSGSIGGFYGTLKSGIGHTVKTVKDVNITDTFKSSEEHLVKKESEVTGKKTSYRDTVEKGAAVGVATLAATGAWAYDHYKKKQQGSTTVQSSETTIKDVQVFIDKWYTSLTERITASIKSQNKTTSVEKIVKEAQSELEVYISQVKKITSEERTFESTLDHIKTTAFTQSSQITQIVNQSSSSTTALIAQIESHVSTSKRQMNTSLEMHYKKETKEYKSEHEYSMVVQESKTQLVNFLILLLGDINKTLDSNSGTIRKDIVSRITKSQTEIHILITQLKSRFTMTSTQQDTQMVNCVERIKSIILLQLSVLQEEIQRTDVEDLQVIMERMEAIITRTQTRIERTFSEGIQGKTETTTTLPKSFKDVRFIAFDLLDTIINYRKNISQQLRQKVSGIDFIQEWHTELKREKRHGISDTVIRHESLLKLLKRHNIQDKFSQADIQQLCAAWTNSSAYHDASIGVRRLKNLKYATVALSDSLSTRSLVDISQNNCLCWNAQFSADMFEGTTEALVKGTIRLLALESPKELAVVSSNQELVNESKKLGCHTILIDRNVTMKETGLEDIKVDGVDVLSESVQALRLSNV